MAKLNVKAGDKVIISTRNGDYITTVEKVTPSGKIKTKVNRSFRSNGTQIGGDAWNTMLLYEYTEERAQKIMREKIVDKAYSKMRKINYNDITYEMACDILKVFEKYQEKGDES